MKYLFVFLSAFFLLSCSDATEESLPDEPEQGNGDGSDPTNDYRLKLGVKVNTLNIFNHFEFSLLDEDRGGLNVSVDKLVAVYDSITWKIEGQQGSSKLFFWVTGDGFYSKHFTFKWSHCFYTPGKYNTYLLGYRDNKIIYSDTLSVDATNRKDFLMFDWNELHDVKYENTGYHNAVNEDYVLSAKPGMNGNIPTLELHFQNSRHEDENRFADKSNLMLYNYITSLYGKPNYDCNSSELTNRYKELFSFVGKELVEPQAIWLTPKNKIVLMLIYNEWWNEAQIYAEPQSLP